MFAIRILYIGIGGFLGAIARYLIGGWIMATDRFSFPLGTFVINVSGSFLIGLFFAMSLRYIGLSAWRPFFAIGFLGAFTTFSTFSLETLQLMHDGSLTLALLNVFASLILCLLGTYIGMLIGERL